MESIMLQREKMATKELADTSCINWEALMKEAPIAFM